MLIEGKPGGCCNKGEGTVCDKVKTAVFSIFGISDILGIDRFLIKNLPRFQGKIGKFIEIIKIYEN